MRQNRRFSLKQFCGVFFFLKKTDGGEKKKDKSKPQQRTGPTPAPGSKQQWACGKAKADEEAADKHRFWPFRLESVRWRKAHAEN